MDVQQVRGVLFPSLSFTLFSLHGNAALHQSASGPTHDEGLPVLSPTPYDSLEANHKIVIEVSYAVTLERGMTNSRAARLLDAHYLY